jgi:DNA-binding transcriptional ArsR family regulator
MRALAHPLRLRILRLMIDRAWTNKEIAARLDRDPGTVLHHVRLLVDAGFLAPEPTREGKRGSVERPYRSTGKSWQIKMLPNADHTASVLEAVRDEILEAGPDADVSSVRLGVRLGDADLAELRQRIRELGDEFEPRDDPKGEPIGLLALVHRRRP